MDMHGTGLKLKYRRLSEPLAWINVAGKKNKQKGKGRGGGGNNQPAKNKGLVHPIGFSGRTLGVMSRRYTETKKK